MKATKHLFVITILFSFMSLSAQDQADAMKKWQEFMTPGAAHQEMAKLAGNWKADITNYMGGQETKAEGSAVYEVILGGRYVKSSFKSSIMGMQMEGMGLDAYDNSKKEYISVWIDNMGTGVTLAKGKWDEATKSIIYLGSTQDAMSGQEVKIKTIWKMEGDDKSIFNMYVIQDGQEIKNMSIIYTRVK